VLQSRSQDSFERGMDLGQQAMQPIRNPSGLTRVAAGDLPHRQPGRQVTGPPMSLATASGKDSIEAGCSTIIRTAPCLAWSFATSSQSRGGQPLVEGLLAARGDGGGPTAPGGVVTKRLVRVGRPVPMPPAAAPRPARRSAR
jgi:hypothetical protein